jgi:hypothetical protein
MFSVITNVYNKEIKGPTLMELFTATGKLKKFFWQLEKFDVCTRGDTAHIDTISKFLPRTHQQPLGQRGHAAVKNIDAPILNRVWQELEYRIDVCRVIRGVHISSCQKRFFSFPVALNNSIKVGPLVFLL